ncbi:MAG: hypothetical protein U9R43_12145 [Thermodesulfobacteriota bacterium]|nr:hypothetical protein [Thermodesulfobacteriota bacterium]
MNTMKNLKKSKIKTIALRHKQLKFDFDQSDARNTKEILTYVDALIADNGHIILKDVITKFSEKPYLWPEKMRLITILIFCSGSYLFMTLMNLS